MIENYLNGDKLVSDATLIDEISQWYKEEEEAYYSLIKQEYGFYLYENN